MAIEGVAEPSPEDRNKRIQQAGNAQSLLNAERELHHLGLDPEFVGTNNESHVHVLSAYATLRILEFAQEKLSTAAIQDTAHITMPDPSQLSFNYNQNIDS